MSATLLPQSFGSRIPPGICPPVTYDGGDPEWSHQFLEALSRSVSAVEKMLEDHALEPDDIISSCEFWRATINGHLAAIRMVSLPQLPPGLGVLHSMDEILDLSDPLERPLLNLLERIEAIYRTAVSRKDFNHLLGPCDNWEFN
ncbi:MAG: hypothetical protein JSS72_12445 [Armatimonadetes bacterium]|nr:hypothetical protein [Armatimonadota bacterium]